MMVFMILVPVTLLVVAGFFIQFAAQFAQGSLKTFGKYLSLWVFVLAALLIVGAAMNPMRGGGFGPRPGMFDMMGGGPGLPPGPGGGPGRDRIFFDDRVPPPPDAGRPPPAPDQPPAPAPAP